MGESPSAIIHHGDLRTYSGTIQTVVDYLPEDREAINLLNQAEVPYELVDLTNCPFRTRLRARIGGIKTPTLVINGKKIVGVENIKQALKDLQTSKRAS